MPDFYGQDFTGSFTGMPGAEGEVPYSINVDTSKLEGAIDIFQNALHQVTDMLGRVVSGVQSVGGTVGSIFSSGSTSPSGFSPPPLSFPYQTINASEAGRYVGHPTYFQSMMGAVGMRSSPFMPAMDYQQMMSRDFAERTTLLGGSVASVGAEMGAGYLGSKLLKPLFGKGTFAMLAGGMTGYLAAAYPLEHLMGKINEGFEFDKLIGDVSSRAGINEGLFDQGINRGHRREITKSLRSTGKELNLGMGDFADIMQYGGEAGMFRGVTDSAQFTETIKVAAKNLKSLMMVLREPDVSEAIRDMATFQQWGVPLAEQSSFAQQAAVTGRMLGMTAKGAMQIAGTGAQMGPQFGYSMAYGAEMSMFGATVGESMLRSKAMTRAEMSIYGGPEGFGQQIAVDVMQTARLPHMQKMMPAFMKSTGTKGEYRLDEEMWDRYMSNEMNVVDVWEEADKRMRSDRTLAIKAKQFTEDLVSKLPEGERTLMRHKFYYDISQMDQYKDREPLELAKMTTGSWELGQRMLSEIQGTPARLEGLRESGKQQLYENMIEKAKTERGLKAIFKKTLWDPTFGDMYGKIQEYGIEPIVDAATDIREGIMGAITRVHHRMLGVEMMDYVGRMPDIPEELSRQDMFQRKVDTEHQMFKQMARESGKDVPYEITKALEKETRLAGLKNFYSLDVPSDLINKIPSYAGKRLLDAGANKNLQGLQKAIGLMQPDAATDILDSDKDVAAFSRIISQDMFIKSVYHPKQIPISEQLKDWDKLDSSIMGKSAILGQYPEEMKRGFGAYGPGSKELIKEYSSGLQVHDWQEDLRTETIGYKGSTQVESDHTKAMADHTRAIKEDIRDRQSHKYKSDGSLPTPELNPGMKHSQGNIFVKRP